MSMRILNLFRQAKWYLVNRFVDKSHLLASSLEPGKYHEVDTRILYANFETLNTFIECELAWFHVITHPKSFPRKFRFGRFRNPEAGLQYLQRESSFKDENGQVLDQALSAMEIIELYNWWNTKRPLKVDKLQKATAALSNTGNADGWDNLLREEDLLYKEDTEMLVRLMKVRHQLWI